MQTVAEWQSKLFDPSLVGTPPVTRTTLIPSKEGHLFVPIQPQVLARQAGVSDEQYSLARVIKSEGWSGPLEQKARALIAIGQTIMNRSGKNLEITRLLTHSVFKEVSGFYGEQRGRVASTAQDPLPYHIALSETLLVQNVENVAGPSVAFLDPWPPGATQRGKKLQDFLKVMRDWHEEDHLAWSGPRGLDPKALMLFYKESDPLKRAASLQAVTAIYRQAFGGGELVASAPNPSSSSSGAGKVVGFAIALLAGLGILAKGRR